MDRDNAPGAAEFVATEEVHAVVAPLAKEIELHVILGSQGVVAAWWQVRDGDQHWFAKVGLS